MSNLPFSRSFPTTDKRHPCLNLCHSSTEQHSLRNKSLIAPSKSALLHNRRPFEFRFRVAYNKGVNLCQLDVSKQKQKATYVIQGSQKMAANRDPKQPKPGTMCQPRPVATTPGLTQYL